MATLARTLILVLSIVAAGCGATDTSELPVGRAAPLQPSQLPEVGLPPPPALAQQEPVPVARRSAAQDGAPPASRPPESRRGARAESRTPSGRSAPGPADVPPALLQLPPLRQVADAAGLLVGTAMSPAVLARDPTHAAVLRREFSSVTPSNAMKWEFVHPEAGRWDFSKADALVEFAEQNNMAVRGHALIMRRAPEWVRRLRGEELAAAVEDHVKTLVGRYRGRVRSWDVVNEIVDDDGRRLYDSVFVRELGRPLVADVFRWAHEADPQALLFYNDYGIELPGPKTDAVYDLLRGLIEEGAPVHGVGFQAHLDIADPPERSQVSQVMRRFANLGLALHITELDVRVAGVTDPWPQRLQRQADVFRDVVSLCGPGSGVDSISFWGFSDKLSWIGDRGGQDAPHLLDEDYQPKPAWFAVHVALATLAEQRSPGPRVRNLERRAAETGGQK